VRHAHPTAQSADDVQLSKHVKGAPANAMHCPWNPRASNGQSDESAHCDVHIPALALSTVIVKHAVSDSQFAAAPGVHSS
jgi:hypothetical protein